MVYLLNLRWKHLQCRYQIDASEFDVKYVMCILPQQFARFCGYNTVEQIGDITVFPRPPRSPDPAPCEFLPFFSKLKQFLSGRHYHVTQRSVNASEIVYLNQPTHFRNEFRISQFVTLLISITPNLSIDISTKVTAARSKKNVAVIQ